MVRMIFAKRCSQAVFEIALEKRELDVWQTDLKRIARLGEDATVTALLESPKFHFNDKAKLLSERLGDINPLALNLVYLLVTKGSFGIVSDIANEYERLLDSHRGIEHGIATTAVPLDDEDKTSLGERLGAIVGKEVMLESEIDPGVIGGIIVRVGGKLIDGSIHSKLTALKRELVGG